MRRLICICILAPASLAQGITTNQIRDGAITFQKIQGVGQNSFVCRVAAGSGPLTTCSPTEVKAALAIAIGDISGLQTALNGKLDTTGGTLSGGLTISAGGLTVSGGLTTDGLTVTSGVTLSGLTVHGGATFKQPADSQPRLAINNTTGALSWGPGNTPPDVILQRTNNTTLSTNADLALTRAAGTIQLTAADGTTQRSLGVSNAGRATWNAGDLLDQYCSTQGALLTRGASGWACLPPGTAGHVLTSQGAGADVAYQAVPSGGGGPTIYTNSPNTDLAINSTSNVNLVSRALTITANTTILIEAWWTLNNNSGAVATYTYGCGIGSTTVNAGDSTTHAASASNRAVHYTQCKISVSSTTLTRLWLRNDRSVPGAANTGLTGAQASRYARQTSTANLTGTQTVTLGVRSSTTTATQTATLESWRITVHPSNP